MSLFRLSPRRPRRPPVGTSRWPADWRDPPAIRLPLPGIRPLAPAPRQDPARAPASQIRAPHAPGDVWQSAVGSRGRVPSWWRYRSAGPADGRPAFLQRRFSRCPIRR